MSQPRLTFLVNMLPSYREGFYRRVLSHPNYSAHILCHTPPPASAIRSIHAKFPGSVTILPGWFMKDEKLVYSKLPWRKLWRYPGTLIVEGNPRYVSHALIATARAISGRDVVLWAMAKSYRANAVREFIRIAWMRIFPKIAVYSDEEVRYLRAKGFRDHLLIGIGNGLDQSIIDDVSQQWPHDALLQWQAAHGIDKRLLLLSCARLIEKNRFDLTCDALVEVRQRFPEVLWCIIGEGPVRSDLKKWIAERGLEANVRFVGAVYEEAQLAPWFLSATAFVHPGAIGLSLLHAMGYGLPVVTHDSASTHGPEFCAFEDGKTGIAFREGDATGLARALLALLNDIGRAEAMGKYGLGQIRQRFNSEVMIQQLLRCVEPT